MFSDVPNLVYTLGYINASWTLRSELVAEYVCRLLNHMRATGMQRVEVALRPEDAERWFNVAPPDLSLIARSRGTDYIYTFLRSFYVAPNRPTGVDNMVLPGTSMPHVLWPLQGIQRAVYVTDEEHGGRT